MLAVGISEIQKNISIIGKLTEAIEIIDKRRNNEKIAVIYPVKKSSVINALAGKYKNRVSYIENIAEAKEQAMIEAMSQKYVSN